jgi:HSP20 family protein
MDAKKLVPQVRRKEAVGAEGESAHPIAIMQREINRMFEDFSRGLDAWPFADRFGTFIPSMNVADTESSVLVTIELPGMDEKDIEVSLTRESLTIRGDKREEKAENTKSFSLLERAYGSFSRTIPLPCEVDEDRALASFKKGVLTVTLPKAGRSTETKKIPIRSE